MIIKILKPLERLIFRQERRTFDFNFIFLFIIFVNFMRGLEEGLFFRGTLSNPMILSYIGFYTTMIFMAAVIISLISKIDFQKVLNVAVIGLFLGIFPPVIDLIIQGGPDRSVGYGYILDLFTATGEWYELIPWFFYLPKRAPVGESITLWGLFFFSAYYVYIQTRSIVKSFLTGVVVYAGTMFIFVIMPSLVHVFIMRDVVSESYRKFMNTIEMHLLSITQLYFVVSLYFIVNRSLFIHIIKRINHAVPFAVMALLGARLTDKIIPMDFFISGVILLVFVTGILQNDLYDKKEDALNKRVSPVTGEDVKFFNYIVIIIILQLYLFSHPAALTLTVIMAVLFLYNYPFYRGKTKFPTNIKIEAICGLMAFLAGVVSHIREGFTGKLAIISFLIFGGWSIISMLKDYKDIEGDREAKVQTGYIFLLKKGLSLRNAHLTISIMSIICLVIPVIWFFINNQIIGGVVMIFTVIIPMILLINAKKRALVYEIQLALSSLFFIEIILFYKGF